MKRLTSNLLKGLKPLKTVTEKVAYPELFGEEDPDLQGGPSVMIPIVCETPGCPGNGDCFNRMSGIAPEAIETFIEDRRGEPEDFCPLCGNLGVACDPEPEPNATE